MTVGNFKGENRGKDGEWIGGGENAEVGGQ